MFSREKGCKIRVKVHGKGAYFFPNRRAWLPLLKLIAVTGVDPCKKQVDTEVNMLVKT